MPVTISLQLSQRDLEFFRQAVRRSQHAIRDADESDVLDAIDAAIDELRYGNPLPDFIAHRLPELAGMTGMLRDHEWRLPVAMRRRLLATLIYFVDPEDLIPDEMPGIGYLDDAIMIELLLSEIKHVCEAYRDFCAYRDTYESRYRTGHDERCRKRRIATKRSQLHARMKRRAARRVTSPRVRVLW
jgi:uncharacterized membrane protein YkvA (DUF1232 family)